MMQEAGQYENGDKHFFTGPETARKNKDQEWAAFYNLRDESELETGHSFCPRPA